MYTTGRLEEGFVKKHTDSVGLRKVLRFCIFNKRLGYYVDTEACWSLDHTLRSKILRPFATGPLTRGGGGRREVCLPLVRIFGDIWGFFDCYN